MMKITKPGIYEIPSEEYHRGALVEGGSLSVSGAKKLLPPYTPATYLHERTHPVFKDIFDFGHAAHKEVLGDEGAELVIIAAPDYKTKAAQEAKKEARLAGKIPLLGKEYEVVKAMADAVKAHPIASELFDRANGKPEQSAFWKDERTGVWRRARFDWLPKAKDGRLIIPDYKTAVSADSEAFSKSAANFGYDMQADWYMECARALGLGTDIGFVFVVQEKHAPYLVNVVQIAPEDMPIARALNNEALDIFAECTKTDTWPGYPDDVSVINMPGFYTYQHKDLIR